MIVAGAVYLVTFLAVAGAAEHPARSVRCHRSAEAARGRPRTALILTQAGATIIAMSWLSVLALVVLIATCEWQVRSVEEPFLIRAHGQAYLAYAHHTGRFLPRLGST